MLPNTHCRCKRSGNFIVSHMRTFVKKIPEIRFFAQFPPIFVHIRKYARCIGRNAASLRRSVTQVFPSGGMVSNVASDKRRMRCPESQLTPHPPLRGPKLAKSVCFSHRRRPSLRRDFYPVSRTKCRVVSAVDSRIAPTVVASNRIKIRATNEIRHFFDGQSGTPVPTVVVSNRIYPSVLGVAV